METQAHLAVVCSRNNSVNDLQLHWRDKVKRIAHCNFFFYENADACRRHHFEDAKWWESRVRDLLHCFFHGYPACHFSLFWGWLFAWCKVLRVLMIFEGKGLMLPRCSHGCFLRLEMRFNPWGCCPSVVDLRHSVGYVWWRLEGKRQQKVVEEDVSFS